MQPAPRQPAPAPKLALAPIEYPSSDGQPMADNTLQFVWIFVLFGNLAALFREREDVFVSGNQNWYPVEGHPEIVAAPDVYVVFGRPKGHRPSWKQWEEGNVPMTVVFEVLSPRNTVFEMSDKLAFYDEHGVEEYYVFDPDGSSLLVYIRGQAALRRVRFQGSFTSPRLGVRFDLTAGAEMRVFYPSGEPFLSFEDLKAAQEAERRRAADAEGRAADAEGRAADAEGRAADAEGRAADAEKRAENVAKQLERAQQSLNRLCDLSRKARQGLATPEELAELERLERDAS